MTTDRDELERLRAEVRHARQRRDLYRAKMYGPRETDPAHFRELERILKSAEERLEFALRQGEARDVDDT